MYLAVDQRTGEQVAIKVAALSDLENLKNEIGVCARVCVADCVLVSCLLSMTLLSLLQPSNA